MKELQPNLYGVIVPENAERFLTSLSGNVFITYDVGANRFEVDTDQNNNIEIIGTASEKEITFDCAKLMFETPKEAFLAFMKHKGIVLKPNEKLLVIRKTN